MKSKICGITDAYTLKFLTEHSLSPQFIGFIVNYPKSKRYVEPSKLKDLLKIDNEMKRNYKIVANMLDDENSLKLAQESWMMTERNACDSKECLINTYAKRMEGLSMEMEGMYE